VRFLIVDTCYPEFLRQHYTGSDLERMPYDVQWRALMDTFFGTADSYSHALGELGHEGHEIVANCAPLQMAWERERGHVGRVPFPLRRDRIVLDQAREYRPDVVYVQNMRYVSRRLLRGLRRQGATLVGQIASEAPSVRKLREYSIVLTSFPHFVDRFRRLGIRTEYLPLAFDPRVLELLEAQHVPRDQYGAVFVGALNRRRHAEGNNVLEGAARRTPVDFWGYAGGAWPVDSPMRRRYHGQAWGLDMFRVLYSSRIALNRHIRVAGDYANNMRLYEATGVGALVLTEERLNLDELFVPGNEVVTYTTEDELVERIDYYLQHDDERRSIAEAGQRRTLSEHTHRHRLERVLELLGAAPC
jgi:spore maturation protein CgeB